MNDFKAMGESQVTKFTAGRYLQALAIAKGNPRSAMAFYESRGDWWNDQSKVASTLKSAISAMGTGDFPENSPVADSFLAAMRDVSVPMRLAGMKKVPMRTRIYVNSTGVICSRVEAGLGVPVLKEKATGPHTPSNPLSTLESSFRPMNWPAAPLPLRRLHFPMIWHRPQQKRKTYRL